MVKSLAFEWPEIPQSVNNLYFTRGGRRILNSEGKRFKNAFILSRGGLSARELMQFVSDNESAYILELWFFLPHEQLFSQSYGQDKRVKSPFKKLDVSNLIKLIEDSIAELLQIRDRNNFSVLAHKRPAADDFVGVVARILPLDLEDDPYALNR